MSYTPNNPYVPGDPYSYDLKWLVQNIHTIESAIETLKKTYTTPTVVDQASEMTDAYKIYVYMGNEIGYNTNHWYYFDPNTNLWTDGGVYGALSPDSALDINSHNAVENSVITAAINTKLNIADIDSSLDAASSDPVKNSVITAALNAKLNIADIDSSLDATSSDPVKNSVITAALNGKQNALTFPLSIAQGGTNAATTTQDTSSITGVHLYHWGDICFLSFRGVNVNSSGKIPTIPASYRPVSYMYCDVILDYGGSMRPARLTLEGDGNTAVIYYNGTTYVSAVGGQLYGSTCFLNRSAE